MVAHHIQGEPDRSDLLPSEVTRYWKYEVCRTSWRKKLPVASASFSGSAAARWAEKARGLACVFESEGRGHRRVLQRGHHPAQTRWSLSLALGRPEAAGLLRLLAGKRFKDNTALLL